MINLSSSGSKAAVIIPCRFYCKETKVIRNLEVSQLKRGTGGRSSFDGNVVTVFGATGFLGRFICNQLGKRGCQLIIPHRCDPDNYNLKRIRLMGDLGQVQFLPFDVKDPISIKKAIKYSNVVINLIGRDYETRNFSYDDVHVRAAQRIAAACKELNIERLIHFSALNVCNKAEKYYMMKLNYLPSKLKGEEAVLEEFPDATIFRPSNMIGTYDKFLWPLCIHARTSFNSLPLYKKGEATYKMPVYAKDVAVAVANAIDDFESRGKIYQAVGPEKYLLKDIACYLMDVIEKPKKHRYNIHDIRYDPLYFAKTIIFRNFFGFFFDNPVRHMSLEGIERESVSDTIDINTPTLTDLGVTPMKFEEVAPSIIFRNFKYNPGKSRFIEQYEIPDSLSTKALNDYNVK